MEGLNKITKTLSLGGLWTEVCPRSLPTVRKEFCGLDGDIPVFVGLTQQLMDTKLTLLGLLKPTGHVMHQQFNIQQLYALPTLYLCVLYLSENKQRLVPLTA